MNLAKLINDNYDVYRNSNNNLIYVDGELLNLSDLTININRQFNTSFTKPEVLNALNNII